MVFNSEQRVGMLFCLFSLIHMPSIANIPENVQETADILFFSSLPNDAFVYIEKREGNRKPSLVRHLPITR